MSTKREDKESKQKKEKEQQNSARNPLSFGLCKTHEYLIQLSKLQGFTAFCL